MAMFKIEGKTLEELVAHREKLVAAGDGMSQYAKKTVARIDKYITEAARESTVPTEPEAEAAQPPAEVEDTKEPEAEDAKEATETDTKEPEAEPEKKPRPAKAGKGKGLTYARIKAIVEDPAALEHKDLLAVHKQIVAELPIASADRRKKVLTEAKKVITKQIRENRAAKKAKPASPATVPAPATETETTEPAKGGVDALREEYRQHHNQPQQRKSPPNANHLALLAKRKELRQRKANGEDVAAEVRENERAIRASRQAGSNGAAPAAQRRMPPTPPAPSGRSGPIVAMIQAREGWPADVRNALVLVVEGLDSEFGV